VRGRASDPRAPPYRLCAGGAVDPDGSLRIRLAPLWGAVYLVSPPGHRRSSVAEPGTAFWAGLASTPLHASIGYLAWPIAGWARDEPDSTAAGAGVTRTALTEESHHKTRQSLIRNELYPVAAALNRSQKRNSVSPPEPEPDEQDGSFELSRLVNQRPATGDTGGTAGKPTFSGPERSRTLPVETAVSDCTSPGAGDRRDPDWLPDG